MLVIKYYSLSVSYFPVAGVLLSFKKNAADLENPVGAGKTCCVSSVAGSAGNDGLCVSKAFGSLKKAGAARYYGAGTPKRRFS